MPRRQEQSIRESASQEQLRNAPFGTQVKPKGPVARDNSKNQSSVILMKDYGQKANEVKTERRHHNLAQKSQLDKNMGAELNYRFGKRTGDCFDNNAHKS